MPTRPAIHAVMVDLDGTLVDTLGDFEVALNCTLADLGLPKVQRALIEQTVGKGSEHLIRSVLAHVLRQVQLLDPQALEQAVQAHYEQAWQAYQAHYHAINGQYAAVYPGVEDGLQGLRAHGLPMACLTNKPLAFAQGLLHAKGLNHFFERVFGGDSFARKKPDPLPLLQTCAALGRAPAHTLMVGDSSNDAQAAQAAGCPVVLMTYGYNHGQPIQDTPALAWLDSLAQLPALLV